MSLERFISQRVKFPLVVFVAALERDQLFRGLEVENQLMQLLSGSYFLQNFFAVVFEAAITYKCFLDGFVLVGNEFAYGKRKRLIFGGRASPAMKLDMQCTNPRLEVANGVLLLLDINPQNSNLILYIFDLLGILLILLLQFPKQMVGLLFKILDHQLLLLLRVDNQILLSIGFHCI